MAEMSQKLMKARAQIIFTDDFYRSFLMRYPCVENENVPAMATDGEVIYVNSKWCEEQSVAALQGVLIHELMHNIYLHFLRCRNLPGFIDPANSKDWTDKQKNAYQAWHTKFNKAADYAINPNVLADNYQLPNDALINKQYSGSMEQIFAKLPDDKGGGGGNWGDVMPGKPMTPEEEAKAARDMEASVREAAAAAKARGHVPGHISELIKAYDEAKVDWATRLWQAADAHGGGRIRKTWKKPKKRFIPHGLYMPSIERFGPGVVVCAIDTSGSVSDKEVSALMTEVAGIHQITKPKELIIIQCDARIQGEPDRFGPEEIIPTEYEIKGRGGTSFNPPFNWIRENEIKPSYMIYLTDGECNFPSAPNFPVIWVITTGIKAPWGETITLSV